MNYSKFSEDDLIEAYSTMLDYSGKVSDELRNEIINRGGLDLFKEKINQKELNRIESDRLLNEIIKHIREKKDYDFIKVNLNSDVWDSEKLSEFIKSRYDQQWEKHIDQSIYPATISGSIHGFIIGSFLGSIVWASSIFYFEKLHFWILIFNFYMAYIFTQLMTGQSKNNFLVYIASVFATIASFFGGFYILEFLDI
jgi:hypothetical protein